MNTPPQDFEELRKLSIMIRQGDVEIAIGKKMSKALAAMVDDPESVATSNIVSLSEFSAVSTASISRMAKLLGFANFNQFQQVFIQRSKYKSDYYSQKAIKLSSNKNLDAMRMIQNQQNSTNKNLERCIEMISEEDILTAARLLLSARRVFIFGYKQSSALASILRYGLCLVRQDVNILDHSNHGLAIALGQLKVADLVVIYASSPYSNLSVEIAKTAKRLSCKVLAFTDSVLSPLNDAADLSIYIPTDGQYYTNSLAANLIFIESLLSIVAIKLGKTAIEKIKAHENLITRINANS